MEQILLTTSSQMMCPHAGQVNAKPNGARNTLTESDTFVVSGCPLPHHPCRTVRWVVANEETKINEKRTLTPASVGLCMSWQGTVNGTVQLLWA